MSFEVKDDFMSQYCWVWLDVQSLTSTTKLLKLWIYFAITHVYDQLHLKICI